MREDTYEQSICYGFMRIMKYICQQNSVGKSTRKGLFNTHYQVLAFEIHSIVLYVHWLMIISKRVWHTIASSRWLPGHDTPHRHSGAHKWEPGYALPWGNCGVFPPRWASGPAPTTYWQRDRHRDLAHHYCIRKVSRAYTKTGLLFLN